ncbi:unnamed protein product [Pleuronectes platessa]|uniref:Uncharacterized protein n=1 Tax=Pleuronectes platessa TaxID=8262 RepID=A0A9N7UAG1_PLEPL|nr:unnamed protein product [Pleuronectes platessa]
MAEEVGIRSRVVNDNGQLPKSQISSSCRGRLASPHGYTLLPRFPACKVLDGDETAGECLFATSSPDEPPNLSSCDKDDAQKPLLLLRGLRLYHCYPMMARRLSLDGGLEEKGAESMHDLSGLSTTIIPAAAAAAAAAVALVVADAAFSLVQKDISESAVGDGDRRVLTAGTSALRAPKPWLTWRSGMRSKRAEMLNLLLHFGRRWVLDV